MKTKMIAMLLPALIWLAACDSTRDERVDDDADTEVRVEERNTPPERDTVFIGVDEKEDPDRKGVEIRVEEDSGDVDFEIKGGN